MAWFWRKNRDRDLLLKSLLEADQEGRRLDAQIKAKQQELELKKIELEYEHLEAIHEEKRKDLKFRDEIRAQQRERAARAREVMAKKRAAGAAGVAAGVPVQCRVCANASDPTLSAHEIVWHSNGHPPGGPGAVSLPQISWPN